MRARPLRSPVRCGLVALMLVMLTPMGTIHGTGTAAKEPSVTLYLTDSTAGAALRPLDASTLADRPDLSPLSLDGVAIDASVAVSADGSTIAVLDGHNRVSIRDARTGRERNALGVDAYGYPVALNRDGSRLVFAVLADFSDTALLVPAWKVFDTATGAEIAAIQGDWNSNVNEQVRVDPGAQRLYRLTVPGGTGSVTRNTGPLPVRIVVHALDSGAEIARLNLPGVVAGFWLSAENADVEGAGDVPLTKRIEPAMALSPDGQTLAVVSASDDSVTVIDTASMRVERTFAFTHETEWWDRLLRVFAFAPVSASAKAQEGTVRRVEFAADGTYVYVTGAQMEVAGSAWETRSLGLRVVDVTSGEVVAYDTSGRFYSVILPAPDGTGLYVAFSDPTAQDAFGDVHLTAPDRLERLDPVTLDVLAQRPMSGIARLVLLPDPASSE